MDSVASDWFWFWLPLLVVVVVVRALAVPSSLLVSWSWLTSLSHHIWGVIQDSAQQTRRLQNGYKRWIFEQKLRLSLLLLLSHLTSYSQIYPAAPSNPSSRSA